MLSSATGFRSRLRSRAPKAKTARPNSFCSRACLCRKFACFAIGNAGFHNPTLYDALRPAVGPLVKLLSDDEEKTRANAAGALGNLVRNNGLLCSEIIKVTRMGPWTHQHIFLLPRVQLADECVLVLHFGLNGLHTSSYM